MTVEHDRNEVRVTRVLVAVALFFLGAGTYHTIDGSSVGLIGTAVGAIIFGTVLWRRRARPWPNRLFSVLLIIAFGSLVAGVITSLDLYIVTGLIQLTILGVAAIALWGNGTDGPRGPA